MNESDRREFKRLLDRVGAYYEHPIQNPATWWDALKPNPIERVAQAFDAWMRSEEGKYPPKPASIIRQIHRLREQEVVDDGRPGPEEAWSIALRARDESETVDWTQEIATALGRAKPVLELGDKVGARMVFKEVYSREVARARDENKPVKWFRSFGYDKKARASQLEDTANRWPLPHLREAERLEHERQGLPENLRERITEVKRHLTHCEPPAKQHDRIQSVVENLPQDRQARKETIAALDTITRRKIEHELGERERERQLKAAHARMAQMNSQPATSASLPGQLGAGKT